jgi:hypothetical protein
MSKININMVGKKSLSFRFFSIESFYINNLAIMDVRNYKNIIYLFLLKIYIKFRETFLTDLFFWLLYVYQIY